LGTGIAAIAQQLAFHNPVIIQRRIRELWATVHVTQRPDMWNACLQQVIHSNCAPLSEFNTGGL